MSLPQCIEGCPQHETRVRHKQNSQQNEFKRGGRVGACESRKDVHNMKARSPDLANSVGQGRQIQDLRGGRGVQGVQGCLGGVQKSVAEFRAKNVKNTKKRCLGGVQVLGGSRGGPEVLGGKTAKGTVWLAYYQDFVQQ